MSITARDSAWRHISTDASRRRTARVEAHLIKRRETRAVSADPTDLAERLLYRGTKRDGAILKS
jgi:hypothetical protein